MLVTWSSLSLLNFGCTRNIIFPQSGWTVCYRHYICEWKLNRKFSVMLLHTAVFQFDMSTRSCLVARIKVIVFFSFLFLFSFYERNENVYYTWTYICSANVLVYILDVCCRSLSSVASIQWIYGFDYYSRSRRVFTRVCVCVSGTRRNLVLLTASGDDRTLFWWLIVFHHCIFPVIFVFRCLSAHFAIQ